MDPWDFRRYLRRTILVPVALLIVLAGVLLLQIRYMASAMRELDHADRVVADSRLMMKLALDMETGLRGYQVTGDERFLEPYLAALEAETSIYNDLRKQVSSDGQQLRYLEQMNDELTEWKKFAEQVIGLRRDGHRYQELALNLEGKKKMDSIRQRRSELVERGQQLREARAASAQRATRSTLATLAVLTISVAGVLVITTGHRLGALSRAYFDLIDLERKQTEEARSSREWLFTTLRSLGECVIATDPSGKIEFLNTAAESLTGWTQNEAQGRKLSEILHTYSENTGEELASITETVRQKRQPLNDTGHVLESRGGQRRFVEESAAPILDSGGELRGVVLVLRDMTEQRKSESVLRSSEKLALIGRLSATIAHEIQNPLDAISNLLFLIEHSSDLPESAAEYTRIAVDELGRISSITRQLLSFNREAKEAVPVDTVEIVESVVALFRPKLIALGIELEMDYRTHNRVVGFPGELRQVFSNLLANAMEATSTGGGRIHIHVTNAPDLRDSGSPGVRVTFSDNGVGIPRDARGSLFTPFFTTKGEKGTGLGLWVSRGIVEKHGGYMRFRSSRTGPYRGTSFSVFLPREADTSSKTNGTAA